MLRWMTFLLAFCSLQGAPAWQVRKRAGGTELKVLRPRSGDTILAEDSSYSFNILWTNNTRDFNASIQVRQGPPNDLRRVATIDASTLNNGSYLWDGRDSRWLRGIGDANPSSGCNYSIEISAGGQRALSEYFTIQNEEDGGLNITIQCPSGNPNITDTNVPTKDKENSGSPRYSAGVLGGAIAGIVAFFILVFAGVFFVGRTKGWISMSNHTKSRGYELTGRAESDVRAADTSITMPPSVGVQDETIASSRRENILSPNEEINQQMRLHQKYGDAQQVDGVQVHQLPG